MGFAVDRRGAFGGNAFIPYFLFPEDVANLHIQG